MYRIILNLQLSATATVCASVDAKQCTSFYEHEWQGIASRRVRRPIVTTDLRPGRRLRRKELWRRAMYNLQLW